MINNFAKNRSIIKNKKSELDTIKDGTEITKTVIVLNEKMYLEENGFGIYNCMDVECEDDDSYYKFSFKGNFISNLVVGSTYIITGKVGSYTNDIYTEKQINVSKIKATRPINKKGIVSYLKGLKGLKNKAEIIYDKYGENSIDMVLNEPLEVARNIKGIGKKSALKWSEELTTIKGNQDVITKLLDYGLTNNQSKKLFDIYKDDILLLIEHNPYRLAKEVKGYSFKSCDRIARNIGYDFKSKFRIQEAIIFVLEESCLEGHCYLPYKELIGRTREVLTHKLTVNEMISLSKIKSETINYTLGKESYILKVNLIKDNLDLYMNEKDIAKRENYKVIVDLVDEADIVLQLEDLRNDDRIVIEEDLKDNYRIYLSNIYNNEQKVANKIIKLCKTKEFPKKVNVEQLLNAYLSKYNISLEEKQKMAVLEFSKNSGGFYILNGPAGCGKTFTLKVIITILSFIYKYLGWELEVKVYAPTGKASKVAERSVQLPCATVHRGLGYSPKDGYKHHEGNPLKCNVLVIDESSMLDINLTRHLLDAIKPGTKVIFLGDIHQLPSVGPGNVLKDLIQCNICKVVSLDVVKRQNLLSGVLKNAMRILNKETIVNCLDTKDAYVIKKEEPYEVVDIILNSAWKLISTKGLSINDIQILCPQKTSMVGTYAFNYLLQQAFNPENNETLIKNKSFELKNNDGMSETVTLYYKKEDKVIHIKNNKSKEWYSFIDGEYTNLKECVGITNGETGTIHDIIKVKTNHNEVVNRVIVRYDEGYVFYDNDDIKELEHSYALTIHKSQGSQWPAVIIPLTMQNYLMLDNNLFYTAYTRAQNMCIVVGQNKAINYAIKNSKTITRYTALTEVIIKLIDNKSTNNTNLIVNY